MASEVAKANQQRHFVLIHGACHGAWCWYKLKPLLESAGHRVTAIDLAASGINLKRPDEIYTIGELDEPLTTFMASLPDNEKAILVGHSLGGFSLAFAMESFPQKISLGVFLTAYMPDVNHSEQYVMDVYRENYDINYVDTQYITYGSPENPERLVLFGPQDLGTHLYQLCPTEDLELARLLVRPSPLLERDLSNRQFSAARYGSVKRAFIMCSQDQGIGITFQRWMLENFPADEVRLIEGADHMAMVSKPEDVCQFLLDLADKYN